MGKKLDGTKRKSNAGRKPVIDEGTIAKLEQAFAIDATVSEACSYADISRDAFYDHLKVNPAFSDRIEDLRNRPMLKARQTIVQSLGLPNHAQWYVERKQKKEFSTRVEQTGAEGTPLFNDNAEELSKLASELNELRKKR